MKLYRFFGMVCLLCMLLSLRVQASVSGTGEYASGETALTEGTNGTIRVDGEAGDTFYAYTVMQIKYNQEANALEYAFHENFQSYLQTRKEAPQTTEAYQKLEPDSAGVKQVLDGYAAYCTANHVPQAYTIAADTAAAVVPGQYVLTGRATQPNRIYQYMTASFPVYITNGVYMLKNQVDISPKYDETGITKEINDTDNHAAIGDSISFSITADIPVYPENAAATTFIVGDHMSKGLALSASSIQVYYTANQALTGNSAEDIGTNPATAWVRLPSGVDIVTETDGFSASFTYSAIRGYAKVMIRYAATLTAEAKAADASGDAAASNTATLQYSSDPFISSGHDEIPSIPSDPVPVYTYKILIEKQSAKDASVKLRGVSFEVKDASGKTVSFVSQGKDGFYRRAVSSEEPEAETQVVTGDNGVLSLDGLDLGTYQIRETATISGYTLLSGTTQVTISDTNQDGVADKAEDGACRVVIKNAPLATNLPRTGGAGAFLFLGTGTLIAVCGMIFIFRGERKLRS